MLAAILAEDGNFARIIAYRSKIHKFSVVHYQDPVKLADNIPELRPSVVVVRECDFPLHWQLLLNEIIYLSTSESTRLPSHFVLFTVPNVVHDEPRFPQLETFIPDMTQLSDAQSGPEPTESIHRYSVMLSTISRSASVALLSKELNKGGAAGLSGLAQKRVSRH
ncbi:MAG TPA: hypothetical protein PK759_06590 [Spirochaetales bacterium]|nr:hypothetical protein [Spirochaetales bacterium]HPS15444.1 hypothetical protein [Spirochaetales bacterium]